MMMMTRLALWIVNRLDFAGLVMVYLRIKERFREGRD